MKIRELKVCGMARIADAISFLLDGQPSSRLPLDSHRQTIPAPPQVIVFQLVLKSIEPGRPTVFLDPIPVL